MANRSIARIDLTGQKFGRLTVLRFSHVTGQGRRTVAYWQCVCDCGRTHTAMGSSLRRGHTQSCGCLQREAAREANLTHGLRGAPEYSTWSAMIQRCTNPSSSGFPDYGGKGITVCERWRSFVSFLADMGPKPTACHSIDRIDGSQGYSPGNCRWATSGQQARNKRNNREITYRGRTLTIRDWSNETGIHYRTLHDRVERGWPIERALTEPAQPRRR